ncbi:MAG: condensation domain-containing protein [Bacillota bacterium]|nr:condensation domain-containing protein [Bacillota bacterium]
MKITIKPGINKVKISYEGIFNDYFKKNKILETMPSIFSYFPNPFETISNNSDQDFTNHTYEKILSNIKDYYRDINNTFGKHVNNASQKSSKDRLKVIPANGHDRCNYVARYGIANFQIQAVIKFDSRLDYDKLSKAVRLSVESEPVLGCRFVESDPPYWKRIDDVDKIKFCFIEETNNVDDAVSRFLESPLDMDKDPMVKLKLIRSDIYDTLCIKINHSCCDGAGTKEYIQLLSELYSSIDQENSKVNIQPRISGRKDQDKLFSTLGIKNPEIGWNPYLDLPKTIWAFPLKYVKTDSIRFVKCSLTQEQMDLLSKYGKARGASINDLLLTAYYRALFHISRPLYGIPMDISSTIDLRRYLPNQKAESIRNFSGGFNTRIARIRDESFDGTLSRIMQETKKIKNGNAGLQNARGAEFIEKMNFNQISDYFKRTSKFSDIASMYSAFNGNICMPGLSNIGFVSKSPIKFGKSVANEAYILPPVVRAPGILLLAGTYNGILTLISGYYKGSISHKDAYGLVARIKDELVNVCRP